MISIRGVGMTNYKKVNKVLLYIIALSLIMIPGVSHAAEAFVFCQGNVLLVFRLFGLVLLVIKIAVPVILMGVTTINILKAMIAGDDKAYKGSAKTFGKRLIISLIIFLMPTIINGVLSLVSSGYANATLEEGASDSFAACTKCLLNVSSCPTTKIQM